VAETLTEIDALLAAAGIEPGADAQLLLGHVLGESRGRVQALAIMGTPISDEDRARVMRLADERASRVPLQHLTGRAAFRGIELEVGPGVFVPRPETESVAQFAIDALAAASVEAAAQDESGPIAVDLCTGSGAIALASPECSARACFSSATVPAAANAERAASIAASAASCVIGFGSPDAFVSFVDTRINPTVTWLLLPRRGHPRAP